MCAVRSILTRIAMRMHDQDVGPGEATAIARINAEVARETGHG